MSKMIATFAMGLISGWLVHSFFSIWGMFDGASKFHILDRPLTLYFKDGSKADLPKESVLHFNKSFPEGFSRYYIYVRIEGAPLDLERSRFLETRSIAAGFDGGDFVP